MKLLKVLIGFVVTMFAVWVVIGEQLSGASSDATVNAELANVRSPIAGSVAMPDIPLGSAVARGDHLGLVTAHLVDRQRLEDLKRELELATAEITRRQEMLEFLKGQLKELTSRSETYASERGAELSERLNRARARLSRLESGDPSSQLAQVFAQGGLSENPGDPLLPGIALEYARERVAALEIELRGAAGGVFLGEGYNDAPWSEQRRFELEREIARAKLDVSEALFEIEATAAQIEAEQARVRKQSDFALKSIVNGLVWERNIRPGGYVERGDRLIRLVDCDSAIVTASVTEETFSRLRVGDTAIFRLYGEAEALPANIIRLGGAGADGLYDNLAIAPSLAHLERFDVALLVSELRDNPNQRCLIGRTGRVFFEARPLDWLRDFG